MDKSLDTDELIQFALGTLEPNQTAEIARQIQGSPALMLELAALQKTLSMLALSVPQTNPSLELEARIHKAIRAKPPRSVPQAKRSLPRSASWVSRTLTSRAIPLLALAFTAFFGWRTVQLETRLQALRLETKTRVSVLAQSQVVQLASTRNVLIGQAFVNQNGQLVIALRLPEAQAGKTYQAWFITKGNAAPQPLETLGNNLDTVIPKNTAVIAISLEPSGGSKTPTEVLGVGAVKL